VASSGVAVDRVQYGYDRNSNRLWRHNATDAASAAFGELYTYDSLNQLTSFQRGTLNGTRDGIVGTVSRNQSWSFDAVGNWSSVTTDGPPAQTRGHNKQNEITSVSGATTPGYDSNGNLTTDEQGRQLVYDAWNRLVNVKTSGGATLSSYAYDALSRRVIETTGGTMSDLYYSSAWQVLEERVGGQAKVQYVWSPVYVDALVERDRDADGNTGNGLEERLYALHDANFNVTALVSTGGAVVERFVYDPYGQATVLDAIWVVRTGGSAYAWRYLHQGGRYDAAAGLYSFRFRDYTPTLGRWTSNDPIGFMSSDTNLYRYEHNAPLRFTDPSGNDVYVYFFEGGGAALLGNRAFERELIDPLKKRLSNEPIHWDGPYKGGSQQVDAWRVIRKIREIALKPVQENCGEDKYHRIVVMGHSWGGHSTIFVVERLGTGKSENLAAPAGRKVAVDLAVTIDPVNWFPIDSLGKVYGGVGKWLNWYQKTDTKTLFYVPWLDVGIPLRGNKLEHPAMVNEEFTAAKFKAFGYDPEHGHMEILKVPAIQETIYKYLKTLADNLWKKKPD
jgi:RHS repeat-associated protein